MTKTLVHNHIIQNHMTWLDNTSFAFTAISKLISSAGQTVVGVQAALTFLADQKYLSLQKTITGGAVFAGGCVNLFLKFPVIYKSFSDKHDTTSIPLVLHHWYAQAFYYTIISLGFISTEISDPLNAYLGGITLLNMVLDNIGISIGHPVIKTAVEQLVAFLLAIGVGLANKKFDFKFVSENTQALARIIDNHDFEMNTGVLLTAIPAVLSMIGSTTLTYYFNVPAIKDIPGTPLLPEFAIPSIAGLLAFSAFGKSIASLPSLYSALSFHKNDPAEPERTYPNSCKSVTVKFAAGLGIFDSAASGLCLLVGIVVVAQELLHLTNEQTHAWDLMLVATIFGLSQLIQNALFSVRPGYKETMRYIHAEEVEEEIVARDLEAGIPLLESETNFPSDVFEPETKTSYYSNGNKSMLFSQSDDESDDADMSQHKLASRQLSRGIGFLQAP